LFTIGWIGSAGNLPFLQDIEAPLADFLARHQDARLLVVADRPPQFSTLASQRWDFRPWHEADEVNAISAMDVGLMPLADTEWARGKCSYKMLQYMACGKPVIVSPVGMNAEVLSAAEVGYGAKKDGDWIDALEAIFYNPEHGSELGRNGRLLIERRFSLDVINSQLANLFRQLI
jgi:glycosyltransferase involved in cell wall biosynthesis